MAEREADRFEARGDSGSVYTVVKMVRLTPFQATTGPLEWLDGPHAYRLLDGRHVNQKNASTFEIFDTEEIIRKIE